MIVLSTKDQEPQSATASGANQEIASAVAIPKITPYAQSAVQADFGIEPKSVSPVDEISELSYFGALLGFCGILSAVPAMAIGAVVISNALH